MALKETIKIDIDTKAVDDIGLALKNIKENLNSKTFKSLSEGLEKAENSAETLAKTLKEAGENGANIDDVLKSAGNDIKSVNSSLESSAQKILFSLSEQGQEIRKQIKEKREQLKDENISQKDKKQIAKEIAELEKKVFDGTETELKTAYARNNALRVRLKTLKDISKIETAVVKAEEKNLATLKKTSKIWDGIKKSASQVATLAKKGFSAGAKGLIGGGKAAIAGAVMGAVSSASTDTMERLNAVRNIKLNATDDEKNEILNKMYILSGKSWAELAVILNRLSKTGLSVEDIKTMAPAAAMNPAAIEAASMRTGGFDKRAFSAIVKTQRSNLESYSAAVERAINRPRQTYKRATVQEVAGLDVELSTVYDDETRERAMRAVLAGYNKSNASTLAEFMKTFDVNKYSRDKRTVHFDFSDISDVNTKPFEFTPTEQKLQTQREAQLTIQEAINKLVESLSKIFVDHKDEFINLITIVCDKLPYIAEIAFRVAKFLLKIPDAVSNFAESVKDATMSVMPKIDENTGRRTGHIMGMRANGGMITRESIVGEFGLKELVIPMQNKARAVSIINNFNVPTTVSTRAFAAASTSTFRGLI